MNILLIGSSFPRSESDDQVPWLREAARRVQDAGHTVEVLAPAWHGQKSHVVDGIPVHRFRYGPAVWEMLTGEEGAPGKVRRNPFLVLLAGVYLWCGFWAVVKLLSGRKINQAIENKKKARGNAPVDNSPSRRRGQRVGPYDLIEVHWPFPHALMAFPAVIAGVPLVYHYHSAEGKLASQNFLFKILFAWSLGWARAHIANSSYTAALIKKVRPQAVVAVIPYGSPIKISEAPVRNNLPRRKILFVGRHIQRKGLPYLIAAMKLLPPDYTLTIVGEGDETPALKALAAGDARIAFSGRLSGAALSQAYLSHDFFVLPAIIDNRGDTEGLGVVLIEAVAAGLPLIASNVGGIPDVILHERTGLLVPQKDPQALAEAIQRLSRDEAFCQQLTAAATVHTRESFSWEAVTQATLEVYARTAEKKQ